MRTIFPFIVALFCWGCLVGFDNHYDVDWRALKCLHAGCSESERAQWWAALILIFFGFFVTIVITITFLVRRFFSFLLMLIVAGGVVFLMFNEAVQAGDTTIFDPRAFFMVASFIFYMSAAVVFLLFGGFSRRGA